MAEVILISGDKSSFEKGKNIHKVFAALRRFGLEDFADKSVLVKLHMGQPGNQYFIKPPIIKRFVDELKAIGAKPFLFETPGRRPGGRFTKEEYMATAKKHGFGKVGCPIVIGNEGNMIEVKVRGKYYGFEVAQELCDADCILSLAHGKGHGMTAFGGSIKAFGMGGVSKESKVFIHKIGVPVIDRALCKLCGACANDCPMGAITVDKAWNLDYDLCGGCERCIRICPSKALKWKEEEFEMMLAAAARACLDEFGTKNRPKKKIFVNILVDISERCDCADDGGRIIAPDIGILVSDDPVAIDAASINLIEKAMGKSLKEVQGADPWRHVKYAEKLEMGKTKYELVKS